jgi:hypothetical protein
LLLMREFVLLPVSCGLMALVHSVEVLRCYTAATITYTSGSFVVQLLSSLVVFRCMSDGMFIKLMISFLACGK